MSRKENFECGYSGCPGRPYGFTYTRAANNPWNIAATPDVTYTYDTDFHGALMSVNSSASSTSYTHDGFGRIASSNQSTAGHSDFPFSYTYSPTDQLASITYPSGRQLIYTFDSADRVTGVQKSGGVTYASLNYTAPGGMNLMTMGNSVTQQVSWNDRGQATGLQVNSPSQASMLALHFYPCTSGLTTCSNGNNGSLRSQTIGVPGLSTLTQSYSYDNLNRLSGATENNNTLENYNYVGNGNRWVSPSPRESTLPPLTLETPQAASWYTNSGVQNRIASWGYDPNGNIMNMGGTPARSFTYDGENRQVSATIVSATAAYVYDGSGQRVSKTAAGQTTYFAYDAFGNLAAEYPTAGSASPCGTPPCYFSVDHLGSTRLITDSASPANVRRYDFLPFGQEIGAGTNGRTTTVGYLASPDTFSMKFTGQSRDSETKDATSLASLDFFNVRYFSSVQGRFQSVDPGNAGANPTDPQTWNAYAYVNNNPLTYTDPSGMSLWSTLWDGTIWLLHNFIIPVSTGGLSNLFGGGSSNSGPWNEQVPVAGVSGGALNTGGVYGSGDTGPFINNILQADKAGSAADLKNYYDALDYLRRDVWMAAIINRLQSSKTVYTVKFQRNGSFADATEPPDVYWDPTGSLMQGGCISPALALGHELSHLDVYNYSHSRFFWGFWPDSQFGTLRERWAITGPERSAADRLGEPRRYSHTPPSNGNRVETSRRSTTRECFPRNVQ